MLDATPQPLRGFPCKPQSPNMPEYRIVIVGEDGHVYRAIPLECDDDVEAIKQAEQFTDHRDVELWQRNRKVIRLERKSKT
jgi:hypothetical protein